MNADPQMIADSIPSLSRSRNALLAIAVGGLSAGTLDLLQASILFGWDIPLSIAGGLLGPSAAHGGAGTFVLGVLLHFSIATSAATVYYLAGRKLPFLTSHAILAGMIFGALVYLFMHYLVLPLSLVPKSHGHLIYKVAEFIEHWFFVGLPISLSVRHYSR